VATFYGLYRETVKREGITGRQKEYFQDLFDILGADGKAKIFIAYANNKPLAASIITFYQGVASYLYGGSSREQKEVMAPFAMHWEALKQAKAMGCYTYDLLGIAPPNQPKHKWAGLTRFKENFGGKSIEIIGSYDKIIDRSYYKVYSFLARMRNR
jgi:lipid II:glycine glycyltransferase (peptidoglycan interpeptide bridge formation enzyme)